MTSMNSLPPASDASSDAPVQWGDKAPKGARAVFSRIIKDGANVPLFLSQTLVSSLRDVGYDSTTSAICEHVDNAIQWGAREIRVYFNQRGRKGDYKVDVLVLDNGQGMSPNVLRAATAFGGSMLYDNRDGIGRYGMGMKAAALSMGKVLELYSWQERGATHQMILDVEEIGNDRSNVVNLEAPKLIESLSPEIRTILTSEMVFPKNAAESQEILAIDEEHLPERLGRSGTIVFVPDCDRLTHRTVKPLVDQATRDMARIYRRHLAKGLKLFINNRQIEPFDPTYRMGLGRHASIPGITETRSRLVREWPIQIPVEEPKDENDAKPTKPITVRVFKLPLEDWSKLTRKILKNDLRVYDSETVSVMRSDREVYHGQMPKIVGKFASSDYWWRMEIDFPPELDEAFGVSFNKQGVRPKGYVTEKIRKEIRDELRSVKDWIFDYMRERATEDSGPKLTEAEKRANEADALMASVLPDHSPKTEEDRKVFEEGLKALAIETKRENETEAQALERVKQSRYITTFTGDEDAHFYRVDYRWGRVILRISRAHPFFTKLYEPLATIAKFATVPPIGDEDPGVDRELLERASSALVSLHLLLLSLGRTQSIMASNDESGDLKNIFDQLRGQWSLSLKMLLTRK